MIKIKGILESGGKRDHTGREINEDGIKILDLTQKSNIAVGIIMDGATGLGREYEIEPNKTPAEWYVEKFINNLTNEIEKTPKINLEILLEKVILKMKTELEEFKEKSQMQLKEYEEPSAGIAFARMSNETTEIYFLGDVNILIGYKNGKLENLTSKWKKRLQKYDRQVIRKMKKISDKTGKDILDVVKTEPIQEMLKENRSNKNTFNHKSYYVCGTEEKIIKYATYKKINNKNLDKIIMMTDGVEYSMLDINKKEFYNKFKVAEPKQIVEEIQQKEDEDNKCNKYPRFKKSDDKSLLLIEF